MIAAIDCPGCGDRCLGKKQIDACPTCGEAFPEEWPEVPVATTAIKEAMVLTVTLGNSAYRIYAGKGGTLVLDHRVAEDWPVLRLVEPDGEVRSFRAVTGWSLVTIAERERYDRESMGGRSVEEYAYLDKARRGEIG